MSPEGKTLWGLSVFFVLLATLYGATAHEVAGFVLLALCAVTTSVAALPLTRRRNPGWSVEGGPAEGGHEAGPAAPVESLWPFVAGMGTVLAVNGLILGPWLLAPGLALVGRGLYGILAGPHAPPPPPGGGGSPGGR